MAAKMRGILFKKRCVDYKGGKCVRCGYTESLSGFDFHHRDISIKNFEITYAKNHKFDQKVLDELDKCDLLCAICHRRIHANENLEPEFIEFLEENPQFKYL